MNLRTVLITFVLLSPSAFAAGVATPAEQLTVPPGFKVELLKSATEREGSWVSMAIDDQGRLYISPQNKAPDGGIMRVTLDESGHIAKTDWLKPDVGAAMGMLWAFNSLYVSGQGPDGQAIYRLRDLDHDGELDKAELFKKVPGGGGEHGAHAIVLGPDNQLYFVHGNSTPLIDGIDPQSPYRNYGEDILIPRIMDPVATFFDKLKVPYGHVLRTDENGTKWELIAGGMRNAYDIDFNADGELFTYDSDMEWDVGLPWYRPSRVLHIVPGAEFGFREGNQKWPDYYPDSLPPVCDIGLGCPTGVKFGSRSYFSERYRRAFFILDWTFGRILAVHLKPNGASYDAANPLKSYLHPSGPEASQDVEVFLSGKGMPLSDLEFGKDGAMYLTVGGRGTQGALYRVSYVGPNPVTATEERNSRMAMGIDTETPHGLLKVSLSPRFFRATLEKTPLEELEGTVRRDTEREFAKFLLHYGALRQGSPSDSTKFDDPIWRNRIRITLENLDVNAWREVALSEGNPRAALTALLALARVGTKDDQAAILKALTRFPLDSLDDELKLLKLRVIKVSFARQGRPAEELVKLEVEKLSRQYPAKTFALNRELSELLIWLTSEMGGRDSRRAQTSGAEAAGIQGSAEASPSLGDAGRDVIEKTLALLETSPAQEEQIWYACMLREAAGWTPSQRERYFPWFAKARAFKGGNSAQKFIGRIKDDALAHVPETERAFFA
ncbi:MAG TPA: hypothetical protein VFD27_11405, partial [Chthoniobacteraceae bacterium]|nr:hypothetical protein [Chthoniobacteraceae bacterium]